MGKILIVMEEEILLEKFLNYAIEAGYDAFGFLWKDIETLENKLKDIDSVEILVLEIESPDLNVKKFIRKVKEKFKNCKILAIFSKMDELIEEFIIDFSIDLYLTFPVLPSQFLRSLHMLEKI